MGLQTILSTKQDADFFLNTMDCRTIAVAVMATLAVLSATSGNVVPNESMQDVVERLMRTTSQLQKKSQDLEAKVTAEKKKNEATEGKMTAEITKLKSEIT